MSGPTEIPRAPRRPTVPGAAGRYGTDRPSHRGLALALGSSLVAALLAWAVWAALDTGHPGVQADVTSYEVVSTHEVRVKVAVHTRDPDADGTCLLRATAEDHTIVGELNLTADELPGGDGFLDPDAHRAARHDRRAGSVHRMTGAC